MGLSGLQRGLAPSGKPASALLGTVEHGADGPKIAWCHDALDDANPAGNLPLESESEQVPAQTTSEDVKSGFLLCCDSAQFVCCMFTPAQRLPR